MYSKHQFSLVLHLIPHADRHQLTGVQLYEDLIWATRWLADQKLAHPHGGSLSALLAAVQLPADPVRRKEMCVQIAMTLCGGTATRSDVLQFLKEVTAHFAFCCAEHPELAIGAARTCCYHVIERLIDPYLAVKEATSVMPVEGADEETTDEDDDKEAV